MENCKSIIAKVNDFLVWRLFCSLATKLFLATSVVSLTPSLTSVTVVV